ncbi:tetratricopeptide repeat protein [Gilvimarinus agarilyticus]|uniref:tetratricopeptide repeat protein n=1 Tax=Gilvimarinus agarilyticus TaxID=679259 RepID=UPI0005A2D1B8|nr:tetratricopeptide repeat protein [Gilvimarinus agarilyticus]
MVELMRSADTEYAAGRLGQAETLYLNVLERNDDYTEAKLKLGNIYNRQGRLDAAATSYSEILESDPDEARAWYNLALTRFRQANATLDKAQQEVDVESPYYERLVRLQKYLLEVSSGIGDEKAAP